MAIQIRFKFYLITVIAILCLKQNGYSSNDSTSISIQNYFVDDAQKLIDKIDGTEDSLIFISNDTILNNQAKNIYIKLVNQIQDYIIKDTVKSSVKIEQLEKLYYLVREVNKNNIADTDKFGKIFRLAFSFLSDTSTSHCLSLLQANLSVSLKLFPFYAHRSFTKDFLISSSTKYPDIIMSNFTKFDSFDFTKSVVEKSAVTAPGTMKRYFLPGNPIFEILKKSEDTIVQTVLKIHSSFGKTTSAYSLLDLVVRKGVSIEKADSITKEPRVFLLALLDLRSERSPLAVHTLEKELEIQSLKYVRIMNDLHNEPDIKRFACIDDFSTEELYTIMVYGQEEIFTSTFNACFKRFILKLSGFNGREFLAMMGDNKFRTFIKLCSGFGKLNEFLATMDVPQRKDLIRKLALSLEKDEFGVSQAIEVADAFASIKDTIVIDLLGATIINEYKRVDSENSTKGRLIYGLLMQFLKDRKNIMQNEMVQIAQAYKILPFDKVVSNDMFDHADQSYWLIYFYDDEDGEASFNTFIASFNDKNWIVRDSGLYVIIQSLSGRAVNIYANKPKAEYDGQEFLQTYFSENNIEPNVVVHRGHSYYAYKTIEKLAFNTKIFVLGSCGGYNSITSVLERSPDVNIISSKQIGTMFVNNPMLKLMAEAVREGDNIEWQKLWEELKTRVISNKEAYSRYQDYIPPHKNLSAIFIKAYNNLVVLQ